MSSILEEILPEDSWKGAILISEHRTRRAACRVQKIISQALHLLDQLVQFKLLIAQVFGTLMLSG